MVDSFRRMARKALCFVLAVTILFMAVPAVNAETTTVVITAGSARAVVNGHPVTMLVPSVVDQASQQPLVPVGFVARQFGYSISLVSQSTAIRLLSSQHAVVVAPGQLEALVDGRLVELSVTPRGLLGEVLVAAPDVQLLLSVQYSRGSVDGESVFTRLSPDPVVEGPVDADAVTIKTYHEQVFMQTVDFIVVRIDLAGKGIRVLSCQSAGGLGTGRYPSAYVDSLKPLALMNATPFNMQSYIMSGSVQDQGIPVYYSGTYISTIGIDARNTPFYVEGTAHAVIRLDAGHDIPVSRINQSPAGCSSASLSLYSTYFSGGFAVGGAEALAVVQDARIVRLVSGAFFTPRTLGAGQIALYAQNPAVVSALRASTGAELHSYVGTRDCTGSTFVQCGPVVVRGGKPYVDYRTYKDISRTSKLGSRAFIGMDDQNHLYFIVTPAKVRLQFGDVSLALSRLGLFTNVVTLDGGSSTTLYYKGQYIIKGTRALTNVLCVPSS